MKKYIFKVLLTLTVFLFLIEFSCASGRFVDNGNDTISDKSTGLMWSKKYYQYNEKHPKHMGKKGIENYRELTSFIDGFNLGGFKDWRLPTVEELKTISIPGYLWYSSFPHPREYFYKSQSAFITNEEIHPYFIKEFTPFSDSVTIENQYDRKIYGYSKNIRFVRGENNNKFVSKREKVEDIIPSDLNLEVKGFVRFKECSHTYYNQSTHILAPLKSDDNSYLTFSPCDGFRFALLENGVINNFSVENDIKNNGIDKIDLWNLNGFGNDYKEFLSLNKFEMAKRKTEILDKIKHLRDSYLSEYKNFSSFSYILYPMTSYMYLKESDYSVDSEILKLKTIDNQSIINKGSSLHFYGATFHPAHIRSNYKNIPLIENIEIKLNIDDASKLFSGGKPYYRTTLIIQPKNKIIDRIGGESIQDFEINAIYTKFLNDGSSIMGVLLHNFQRVYDNRNKFKKYKWETKIIKSDI